MPIVIVSFDCQVDMPETQLGRISQWGLLTVAFEELS